MSLHHNIVMHGLTYLLDKHLTGTMEWKNIHASQVSICLLRVNSSSSLSLSCHVSGVTHDPARAAQHPPQQSTSTSLTSVVTTITSGDL